MALVRRGAAGAGAAGVAAADAEMGKLVPTVVEFLTQNKWEDGADRKTGTVMILTEDGVWKAWVHDRDGGCSCWVSAGTLVDLADAVEKALGDQTTNWRKDGFKGKR